MLKTAIIGDIHGMLDQFKELVLLLEAEGVERFVLLGDLVDKGPKSAEVVAFARELFLQYRESVLVMGNHEEKHARFRKHAEQNTGRQYKMYGWKELQSITDDLSRKDIEFLESAVLYCKLPAYNAICVHGGISPSIKWLPSMDEYWAMSNKSRKFFNQMLRVRYVNSEGRMVHLGHESDEDSFWADIYDGRFGKAYYGHQPYMQEQPKEHDHAVGMDLGCVFGGKLAASILSSEGCKYLTVDGIKCCEPWSFKS